MPAVRSRARACDEASMTHDRSPPSTISRNRRCSSIDSGVVSLVGRSTPAMRLTTVPSSAGRRPAAARMAGQQVSGRRLAVGAGDGRDPQLARGLAVEARRQQGHGAPRAGHEELGDGQRQGVARTRGPRRRPRPPRGRSRGRRPSGRGCRKRGSRRRRRGCCMRAIRSRRRDRRRCDLDQGRRRERLGSCGPMIPETRRPHGAISRRCRA